MNTNTDTEPVELDRDIVYRETENKSNKKSSMVPWPYIVGGVGLLLIIVLLFINPVNGGFVDSPPPEEQAERDSIFSAEAGIRNYVLLNDSLPSPEDISLPAGFIYEKEDEIFWSIETEEGLYYTSDMDIESFRLGEI